MPTKAEAGRPLIRIHSNGLQTSVWVDDVPVANLMGVYFMSGREHASLRYMVGEKLEDGILYKVTEFILEPYPDTDAADGKFTAVATKEVVVSPEEFRRYIPEYLIKSILEV